MPEPKERKERSPFTVMAEWPFVNKVVEHGREKAEYVESVSENSRVQSHFGRWRVRI